jgi:hypothetical protein
MEYIFFESGINLSSHKVLIKAIFKASILDPVKTYSSVSGDGTRQAQRPL